MNVRKLINFFHSFIHNSLDLIFPRRCFGCRKDGSRLCLECLNKLPRFWSNEDRIFAVFDYDSPIIKQAIWALKYKNATDLAEILARPMMDILLSELEEELVTTTEKIILIPVPLSRARFRLRGYNQSEELARRIYQLNPNQFSLNTSLVKKVRETPSQVSLRNREERLRNLRGAFVTQIDTCQTIPKDKILVIIDDVSTTGATISEIRKVLAQAGLKRVYGLVIAHN